MTKVWEDSRGKQGSDSDKSRHLPDCPDYLSVTLILPMAPRSISANW